MQRLYSLILGTLFGVVLIKSDVSSWFRIQKMFRFEETHMYLIIGSAVVVAAIMMYLLRRLQAKTLTGQALPVVEKKFHKGIVFGGLLFGLGWAITGACPGPIYAQIGSGQWLALISFVGAFGGAYLYAFTRPYLPH